VALTACRVILAHSYNGRSPTSTIPAERGCVSAGHFGVTIPADRAFSREPRCPPRVGRSGAAPLRGRIAGRILRHDGGGTLLAADRAPALTPLRAESFDLEGRR
jgi:hypothetical protein